jgi:hypothetical protein
MKEEQAQRTGRIPAYLIYGFLWIFFLLIPVITNNYESGDDFKRIQYDWLRMSPFFIVFLINSFLLLPLVLFRGHTKYYLVILLLSAGIVTGIFQIMGPVLYKNDPGLIQERLLQDPQWGREEMNPNSPGTGFPGSTGIFKPPVEESRRMTDPYPTLFQFVNTLVISLLVAGFNTAIAMTNKWVTEEQSRKEAEREHIRSELAFLQNQVSPHFFMNTLNNIHSLVDADKELAQDAILRLSALMRYLLYESGRGTTTLSKEIEFLRSYVNLMQLRVDESVSINLELPGNIEDISLPPLLFISFIENAFKHGVSYRERSSLSFCLRQYDHSLEFISSNTISAFNDQKSSNNQGGIGLENTRKRLHLLYGENYKLDITNNDKEFRVRLIIPV